MADNTRDKMGQAGQGTVDVAKDTGQKMDPGTKEQSFPKDKSDASCCGQQSSCSTGTGQVKEHMDVIASCGTKIGVVDRVENDAIKLTKNDSPDGQHHCIPNSWVDHVDNSVHLNKNSEDAKRNWQSA